MIRQLLTKPARGRLGVAPGRVLYAIGDVHGRDDLLARMLAAISAECREHGDEVVVVPLGDYVDRGPDGIAVLRRLEAGLPAFDRFVPLMGNHEYALLSAIDRPGPTTLSWMAGHGESVLRELGIEVEDRDYDMPSRFSGRLREAIGEDLVRFLRELPLGMIVDDVSMNHAGAGQGAEAWTDVGPTLWGSNGRPAGRARRIVVHGHWDLDEPEWRDDYLCIDTRAYESGVLTAVRFVGTEATVLQVTDDER